ncbi:MAG: MarR family transcriptional regulator [Alphaproteobacteria bacterium]|nr:MarR family transcriptional regulator [Alphaproteobacteria bacterium]
MLLLARAARAAQQASDAGLVDLGLTSAQAGVLFAVPKEGGVGVSAIAEQMGLAQSVVSVLTQRLVEQGFLARAPDPDDRRAVRLSLTAAGATARAEAARRARGLNTRITREFSAAEQAAIARFLEGVIGLKEVGDD